MDAKRWGIILDLDQTLVLTSELDSLRKQRAWQEIYRSFFKTKLPPGTSEFLDITKMYGSVVIVTTSPRPYAEKLLKFHNLSVPVAIAYHDVKRVKPDPEPILKAAELIRIPPSCCVCIGDHKNDMIAAARAEAIPIGLSWDGAFWDKEARDLALDICTNWDEVLKIIENIILIDVLGR